MYKYFLNNPILDNNEKKYVNECIKSGWIANGKFINKFTNLLKKYTNAKYVVPCVNGTSALHIALKVVGVKENDEVIVPTTTFIAPINAIKYNLASPIFFDVENDFTINVIQVVNFLENYTAFKNGHTINIKTNKIIRAIVVVHTFGNAARLDKLIAICKKKNIKIVEDAAESLGTFYKKNILRGKHTGTIGDVGCLSFNSNKIITTGGGGAILLKSQKVSKNCEYLINQAKDDALRYKHDSIGYNYRINNISAAIGFAQLKNIKKILNKKKFINKLYKKYLNNQKYFTIIENPQYSSNNNWLNILKINGIYYDKIIGLVKYLKKFNIEARPIWYANHLQKPFVKCQAYKISKAIELQESCICLPSSHSLCEKDIKSISIKIINFFQKTL